MQHLEALLRKCHDLGGSDLHFKTDTGKAYVRVNGELNQVEDFPSYTNAEFQAALFDLLLPEQSKKLEKDLELDFAFEILACAASAETLTNNAAARKPLFA